MLAWLAVKLHCFRRHTQSIQPEQVFSLRQCTETWHCSGMLTAAQIELPSFWRTFSSQFLSVSLSFSYPHMRIHTICALSVQHTICPEPTEQPSKTGQIIVMVTTWEILPKIEDSVAKRITQSQFWQAHSIPKKIQDGGMSKTHFIQYWKVSKSKLKWIVYLYFYIPLA